MMLKKVKRIKLGKLVYRRLMKRVLERDGWRCQKCGSLENLQVHHKIRRSQQGDDCLANLVTLCAYCHMAEHGQLSYSQTPTNAAPGQSLDPSSAFAVKAPSAAGE
jgi:5-methylcytosine-specific restriction endonuclease McrA